MTQITGKFVDSGGVAFDGDLTLTLDAPLVDSGTTPDSIYTLNPHTFTFSSGTLSGVNVAQSETANVTYHLTVNKYTSKTTYWLADGTQYDGPVVVEGGLYYTGTFYDADTSQRLGQVTTTESSVVMDFHAVVPNTASVEFADLIPTRVSTDSLPRTVRAIAELLTADPDFVEALRGGPRFKGAYSAATYYQRDDAVTYGGSSWVYINADPAANQTPSLVNTTYWQILAQQGDPGGTGGNDTAYDATGWNGQTDAPSRNAVRDIIVQLATLAQLATYAPLASPSFTGSPNSPTPLSSAVGTEIATAAWVRSLFALLNSPTFTGNPAAPTQSITDESNKLATTSYVKNKLFNSGAFCAQKTTSQTLTNDVYTVLNFNVELVDIDNAFANSTSTYTAASAGWYEFSLSCRVQRTGGTSITFFIGSAFIGSDEYRLWEVNGNSAIAETGTIQLYLTAGQSVQFKVRISSDGTVSNDNSGANTYFTRCSGKRLFW